MNDNLKISIITPSLNQGDYIEDSIKSVINQNYKNFEHIIIDGGSTDQTLEIIKKYPHIIWISEKDTGQSNAINKGFKLANGDIISWLNSDDFYDTDVFKVVSDYFNTNGDCYFIYGDITYVDKFKNYKKKIIGGTISFKNLLKNPDLVRQPSSFWRRSVLNEVGYLEESLHVVMDLDFFLRLGKKYEFYYINKNFSYFRTYKENKTSSQVRQQALEIFKVLKKYPRFLGLKSYKFIFGRYLDSLNDKNWIKKIFSILRKKTK